MSWYEYKHKRSYVLQFTLRSFQKIIYNKTGVCIPKLLNFISIVEHCFIDFVINT